MLNRIKGISKTKLPHLCNDCMCFHQSNFLSSKLWCCRCQRIMATSPLRSPAVCEEASVSMTGSVTTRGGAGGSLGLEGLPVEGCSIQESLFLPPRRQWTTVGAAVSGVFAADVTQTVAARNRTSAGGKREQRGGRHCMKR